jgi:hypothetical protein
MQSPSYPFTHPPLTFVSEQSVIPKQLVPLVVQLDEIALHELWVFQFKLLHEVYG